MTEAAHVFKELRFYFRNGDEWTVSHAEMADVWIARVTTSYGRINGTGRMQEIHPCKSFKIEILPEADHSKSTDINSGSLELGMFGRATKYQDIEKCDLVFEEASRQPLQIYFPFKQKDVSGLDNVYQTSMISPKNGHLYVVIDADKTVFDVFPQLAQ
ncbi:hypothetical protein [Lapidilactobacillus gannanensis]|jgi:hypothetical protein|uniref:Uncharacterized protein n=1 Tax=Lapidilactobacillus gannanensis TaxID=2486002 RepID=A0ABW4BRL5_9LACO|nr:hypothetical protein [Lapidilactobacillus gannanensis]MCH4057384.1 hypothetical protein [Lactobacillaceae bacterium]